MSKAKKKATVKKKTHRCVTIRFNMKDFRDVKKKADDEHLPVATYLRKMSLEG